MVVQSTMIQKKTSKKDRKKNAAIDKAAKKTAKKVGKKTTRVTAKPKADTKAKQKELAQFHAPSGFRFTAKASKDALELAAKIDLAKLREADAASDLTRIRKVREKAEKDLKTHIQGEDPTGTLFAGEPDDDGEE